MDIDFASLAAKIAADIQDLRGCVIVSRDGLVLGSYPTDAEATLRPAWLRFASLGDVEKGFVQFSGELWVYVRRGPYASFAVSTSLGRPGLILDELEQVLLSAGEARTASSSLAPPAGGAPSSRPRTSLHPEPKPAQPAPAPVEAAADRAELSATAVPATDEPRIIQSTEVPASTEVPQAAEEPQAPDEPESELPVPQLPVPPAAAKPPPSQQGDDTVDRVALAQEFAQLLGESGYDDEDPDY